MASHSISDNGDDGKSRICQNRVTGDVLEGIAHFARIEAMMTPEERYTRMENLVQSIVETQAHLSESQTKLSARQDQLAEQQEKQQILIDENRTAIRDLITVSRTLLESQKETAAKLNQLAEKIDRLAETVREHEGKIDALIDTVDRIIRRDQPPS